MNIIETPLKIHDFKIGDLVTPLSVNNHAYGKTLIVSEIWEIGRGGKDGRVIASGFSFMPWQLKNQRKLSLP